MGTIALATPASNRGSGPSFMPALKSFVFIAPLWFRSTITRSPAFTVTGPDQMVLSLFRGGHLIVARLHEQPLVPNKVVVEFIDVADKIRGRRAIEQNRRARVAFEFDIAEGPVHFVAGSLEGDVQVRRLPCRDVHIFRLGSVPVVVDADAVAAGAQLDGLAAVANRFSIHEDVGLFWTDVNFQFSGRLAALCECGSDSQRQESRSGKKQPQWGF